MGEAPREHAGRARALGPRVARALLLFGVVVLLALTGWAATAGRQQPSHDRDWAVEQARLPEVRTHGDTVRVANLRDFRHTPDQPPEVRWTRGEYHLERLARVWFVLSPFSPRFKGLAHPFLSFEFEDGRFLAVSVEARKEAGETYSPVRGMLRRFETMVVLGTEPDLLGLRAVAWDDPLFLYPVAVTRDQGRQLLVALLDRAREIEARPEFYNTITNNCTTNLLRPINLMADRKVGHVVGLLPGYSFDAAFRRGWIDTDLPVEEARAAHRLNERVQAAIGDPDFSRTIRAHLPRGPG